MMKIICLWMAFVMMSNSLFADIHPAAAVGYGLLGFSTASLLGVSVGYAGKTHQDQEAAFAKGSYEGQMALYSIATVATSLSTIFGLIGMVKNKKHYGQLSFVTSLLTVGMVIGGLTGTCAATKESTDPVGVAFSTGIVGFVLGLGNAVFNLFMLQKYCKANQHGDPSAV